MTKVSSSIQLNSLEKIGLHKRGQYIKQLLATTHYKVPWATILYILAFARYLAIAANFILCARGELFNVSENRT